jgi:hypothetical protein
MEKQENEKYVNELYSTFAYGIAQFDKNILYISTGALGLSITIIDSIIKLETAICKSILLCSWYLLAFTILLSLYSHMLSYQLTNKLIEVVGNEEIDEEKLRNKSNIKISRINKLMLATLVFGIICFIIFININIFKNG